MDLDGRVIWRDRSASANPEAHPLLARSGRDRPRPCAATTEREVVRSRIESHAPSFDFERANPERLVDLVTSAATEPELQARTIDALAVELVDLATAERDRVRWGRADLQRTMESYFDSSALGVLHSVQVSLGKWKLGSIYEPQLPRFSSPLADSVAQFGTKVLCGVEMPSFHPDGRDYRVGGGSRERPNRWPRTSAATRFRDRRPHPAHGYRS
jgi:hypothetical protein